MAPDFYNGFLPERGYQSVNFLRIIARKEVAPTPIPVNSAGAGGQRRCTPASDRWNISFLVGVLFPVVVSEVLTIRFVEFPYWNSLQVTIKTNLLAELKHQAPNHVGRIVQCAIIPLFWEGAPRPRGNNLVRFAASRSAINWPPPIYRL